jgi:hypothetical protein
MIWLLDGRSMVFGLNEFGLDDVERFEQIDVSRWIGLPRPDVGMECSRADAGRPGKRRRRGGGAPAEERRADEDGDLARGAGCGEAAPGEGELLCLAVLRGDRGGVQEAQGGR